MVLPTLISQLKKSLDLNAALDLIRRQLNLIWIRFRVTTDFKCQKLGAFDSAKNHKRQRRKRQSVTAKREKSQTPKFVKVRLGQVRFS